ncbi:DeoR/GlpR family DNA-binding transcription regulator [Vaginisenegalia massiliensis]|uniref:DeoR/GlpR family DNA-binding transcription regulator n=1 Tax=Vaginisenegalia massiliensis TaxID=2058294 RepID=UPI000F5358A2|nr:DeoR/GlpR family DNA-binding transcription regulator [Vaginisenegalia massiliensis]
MLTPDREEYILRKLNEERTVKLQELMEEMNVSESTIRRDLSQLEERGLLTRVHGGAKLNYRLDSEPSYDEKVSQNNQEKIMIAKRAASFIKNGEVIFLDAGTTTLRLIDFLEQKPSIVVTNGLRQAEILSRAGYHTLLLGGTVKQGTQAIVGNMAQAQIQQYRFDKAFLGMNGIHPELGLTTADDEEAAIKQTALKHASRAIVLVDHTKFNKVNFCKVGNLDEVTIVTDHLDNKLKKEFSHFTTLLEALA